MPTHKSYNAYLIESLKDPLEAAAYLEAVFEDGDAEHVALAIKNVAEARSVKPKTLEASGFESESHYQAIIEGSIPALSEIASLLNDLGLKLSVSVKEQKVA